MRKTLVILLFSIATCAPVFAQAPALGLKDILSGNQYPLSMKLKDLNPSWRSFTAGGPLELGRLTHLLGSILGGSGLYYTQGEQVTLGSETYLVSYRARGPQINLGMLAPLGSGTMPVVPKATPDTSLLLTLLNVRTMGSIQDIRPFDLQTEIDDANGPTVIETALVNARQTALDVASESNLKQLGVAVFIYSQDYDEKFPPATSAAAFKKALLPYIKSEDAFIQPRTKQPYLPNPWLSSKNATVVANPTEFVLAYEAGPAPDGKRAVVYVDGHVKRIPETEWPQIKKTSHIP